MCERVRCSLRPDDIPRACHRSGAPTRVLDMDGYRPRYNVFPAWGMPVVRREDASDSEGYVIHCMTWGLIPSFTKKTEIPDHDKMFNARSESIDEKAFRRLVPKNRCLVAVEGFYEWKYDGSKKKQPYYIHFKDGRPLVFAALYDSWKYSKDEILYSFTIVTTSSSSALQWLHDRMPVILGDKDSTDTWLSGSASSCKSMLKPYEESDLAWHPVTPVMVCTHYDGPICIEEIQVKAEGNNSISKFSRKGAEGKDTKPEHKISFLESVKTKHTKDISQGAKNKEGDDYLKSSGSSHHQNVTKLPIKREYDVFSADSKPALANNAQVSANPAKKKEKAKTADDKQPTLFCYFGKSTLSSSQYPRDITNIIQQLEQRVKEAVERAVQAEERAARAEEQAQRAAEAFMKQMEQLTQSVASIQQQINTTVDHPRRCCHSDSEDYEIDYVSPL